MKKIFQILILIVFTFGCTPKAPAADMLYDENEMLNENKTEEPALLKTTDKKIIKNGRLGIKVKELAPEKKYVDSLVQKLGAYYDKENLNNTDSEIAFNLTIRIPNNKFESFISLLEKNGNEISYKEIDAQDVTEQFIDLETRLNNKRKYMARYQELLNSAKSIKEVLEIQEKIRALEEEIESTTGRLKYLSNQVNFSTLELYIFQNKDYRYLPENRNNTFEKLKQSFFGGWYVFIDFLFLLLYNWMFIILISIGIYFWIKYRRKKKAKKQMN